MLFRWAGAIGIIIYAMVEDAAIENCTRSIGVIFGIVLAINIVDNLKGRGVLSKYRPSTQKTYQAHH